MYKFSFLKYPHNSRNLILISAIRFGQETKNPQRIQNCLTKLRIVMYGVSDLKSQTSNGTVPQSGIECTL